MNENEVIKEEIDNGSGQEPVTPEPAEQSSVKDMKHLDFITSIVVMALAVYVAHQSNQFFIRSPREHFYASPGFMPAIIATALFLLGLSLFIQSLKDSSIKKNFIRLVEATPNGLKSARFKNTVIGLAIFALYIFVLLRFLPFWLASIIVLFSCFMYLKAAKPLKSAIIAILSAGAIVLIFQELFRVPMP